MKIKFYIISTTFIIQFVVVVTTLYNDVEGSEIMVEF